MGKSIGSHPIWGKVVPSDRPPDTFDANIRRVEFVAKEFEGENYVEVWSKERWMKEKRKIAAEVKTMYKRKDKKVNPVNTPLSNGINPGGGVQSTAHAGKRVPRGSRLTPERLAKMRIGHGFLSENEKQLFVDILYEFEAAIAFDDSEMGLLDPAIERPVVMHTVPHAPWQQNNLRLPKLMQDEATRHVK